MRPNLAERYIYTSDEYKVAVETIRVCRLKLDSSFFVLDLDETLYVPSF